ncbi:hypothetical protein GCM10020000_55750 [Streptomyces olivoverticillatus]
MRLSGQVRPGMSTASYGRYLCTGIPEGRWVTVAAVRGVGRPTDWEISGICAGSWGIHGGRPTGAARKRDRRSTGLRGEGVGLRLQALAAAAKEKQHITHGASHLSRGGRDAADRSSMRNGGTPSGSWGRPGEEPDHSNS